MEWALPPLPQGLSTIPSPLADMEPPKTPPKQPHPESTPCSSPSPSPTQAREESDGESFAFALVNGSVGVFEVSGGRVRDFRPVWPPSSFVNMDVPVTALAYRFPHIVLSLSVLVLFLPMSD